MKRPFTLLLATVLLFSFGCEQIDEDYPYSWKPERPMTIIVPWAAGGSTDQVTRVAAKELENALGQTVVIANQSGASGSIGTRNALRADPDGYTWTSGAASSLGTYSVLGLVDTDLDDWHLFLTVANVAVVSVNPDSPYEDFGDLLAAMEEDPRISVATAGTASSGHNVMDLISKTAGVDYRHVSYDGGNPAVISTVSGETQVTTQLATEQVEMIRGERLRPLATLSKEPLEIEGYGEIPSIYEWLPDIDYATNYFGIWVRKGVPDEVLETMERIWEEQISNSEELKRYARQQGAIHTPYYGEDARERVWEKVKSDAWVLYDSGQAEVSPEELGIPRP